MRTRCITRPARTGNRTACSVGCATQGRPSRTEPHYLRSITASVARLAAATASAPHAAIAFSFPTATAIRPITMTVRAFIAALREVGASLGLDPATLATWLKAPAQRREKELPLLKAIVKFAAPPSGR